MPENNPCGPRGVPTDAQIDRNGTFETAPNAPGVTPDGALSNGVAGESGTSIDPLRDANGRYLAGRHAADEPLTTLDSRRSQLLEHVGDEASVTERAIAELTANMLAQADALAAKIAARGPSSRAGRVRSVQSQYLKLVAQIERNLRLLGMRKRGASPNFAEVMARRKSEKR